MDIYHANLIHLISFISIMLAYYKMSNKDNYSKERDPQDTDISTFKYVSRAVTFFILILNISHFFFINSPLNIFIYASSYASLLGVALTLFSTIIFFIARKNLSHNYSPCDDPYLPNQIVQEGIFKYIRHPFYSTTSGVLLGTSISYGSLLMFMNFLIIFIFQYISSLNEEKELSNKFPEYITYMEKTGRFLPKI